MSSRALRRLREEKEAAAALEAANEEDEESSEEEEEDNNIGGGFTMMLDEDSESSSDEDDSEIKKEQAPVKPNPKPKVEKEEDLDAILSDMNIKSSDHSTNIDDTTVEEEPNTVRSILLSKTKGFDVQDMDLDAALRALVGGGAAGAGVAAGIDDPFADQIPQQQQRVIRGRNRGGHRNNPRSRGGPSKKYIFGKARAEWGKPPSYVGGGLGVKELTKEVVLEEGEGRRNNAWSIPWPYNLNTDEDEKKEEDGEAENKSEGDVVDESSAHNNNTSNNIIPSSSSNQKWYSLQMSDTYHEVNYTYQEMLSGNQQGTGAGALHDPNSLAMFVADNPYFAESLLQLAMVLYYVNDRGRGSDLLRRCMFVYESALPTAVLPSNDKEKSNVEVLIDIDRQPNAGLFATLFRVMQTSGMSGCYNSALATGRYLLSLDPLRDPMGVLLILDFYALASRSPTDEGIDAGASFIVNLVDSNFISAHYKDPLTDRHHSCALVDMPNWAYSYALALYRLSQNEDDDEAEKNQELADDALVIALEKFPMVLPKLLIMNDVNIEDRSMIMDWQSVLSLFMPDANGTNVTTDTVEDRVTRASGEHMVKIFVQRSHKLWKDDDVVKWLYCCCERVAMEYTEQYKNDGPGLTSSFEPAIARYAQCDPSEYEDAFRTFPPEAIALNPNLVAPAMALGPNGRRRFLRRGQQQHQQQQDQLDELLEGQDPQDVIRQMLGLGNGGAGGLGGEVEVLDPDSPLLNLYLQSLFPWAQVDGVRPPRNG